MSSGTCRVVTIRRDLDRSSAHTADEASRVVHVVAGRPGTTVATAHRVVLDDLHHVVAATESIANGHGPDAGWALDDERYVLVCTNNGRHEHVLPRRTAARSSATSTTGTLGSSRVGVLAHRR